ncbi:MAG: alpha/beta hydrolase [Gammaproteobacteria bacterium]|nr:alpha/beta hydrolase [Gammaproteobacteria bacterium]
MHRISVNGTRISCVDTGKGAPLLLLHGLGGSHDDWRLQIPEFAARYRVIVPDLRGFGASERREPFTIQRHARDMMALLSALELERVHVVGLSMGGAVAIELALRAPQTVASLVLVNTAPGFTLTNWQRRRMAWLRVLVALVLGVGGVARLFAQGVFPARSQGRLRRRFIRRASHTSRWVYLATLRSLTRWNAESRLHLIRAPALIIGAEHDFTTSEEKRRWCARIRGARFIEISGSHHHTELDSPGRFNRVVLSHLATLND